MVKGKNIELRKRQYRNRILSIIRNNENVSRFDIKKFTHYSMTTTLNIIDEMITEGFLIESGMGESTGGRKPTWIKINPQGGYFFGIEFYAQNIFSVILDFSGSIIYSNHLSIPMELNTSMNIIIFIKEEIRRMFVKIPQNARVFGIGLGIPGYMDVNKGVALNYHYIRNWENINLKQEIEKEFKINVYIENSINAMALAYKWLEFGGISNNFLFLCIRTGIRIANIVRGHILCGRNNAAGEIDHFKLSYSDRLCYCGQKGCLVNEASNGAIIAKAVEGLINGKFPILNRIIGGDYSKLNMQSIVKSYNDGDPDSKQLVRDVAGYIGEVLATAVMLNDPEVIVIYTDLSKCGDEFINIVREYLSKRCFSHNISSLKIEYNRYGENIGAIGAASIVMQEEISFSSAEGF